MWCENFLFPISPIWHVPVHPETGRDKQVYRCTPLLEDRETGCRLTWVGGKKMFWNLAFRHSLQSMMGKEGVCVFAWPCCKGRRTELYALDLVRSGPHTLYFLVRKRTRSFAKCAHSARRPYLPAPHISISPPHTLVTTTHAYLYVTLKHTNSVPLDEGEKGEVARES